MNKQIIKYGLIVTILLSVLIIGCEMDLKVGTLSVDMKYYDKKQETTVGLSGVFGDFYFSKSSLPIQFEIVKIYEENGGSIAELSDLVTISVYDQKVVNGDSDLAKEMKSDSVQTEAVQINKFTGELVVHKNNKVLPGTYHFDIRLTNVSGTKLIEDALILKMNGFSMSSFSTDFGGKPEINYLGTTPEQIVFKLFKYNAETKLFDKMSTVDHLYIKRSAFVGNDDSYIQSDQDDEGEIWKLKFPISFNGDFYDLVDNSYVNAGWANIDFGQPGNYEVKLFMK